MTRRTDNAPSSAGATVDLTTITTDINNAETEISALQAKTAYQSVNGNVTNVSAYLKAEMGMYAPSITNSGGGNLTVGNGTTGVVVSSTPLMVYNTSSSPQAQLIGTSSQYGTLSFQNDVSTTKSSIYSSSTAGLTADMGSSNFYIASSGTNKTSFDLSGNIATQGKITTGGDITCQNNRFSTLRSDCSSNMLTITTLNSATQYQSASSNTTTFSGTVSTANLTNGAGGNLTLGSGTTGVVVNGTPLYVYNTSSTPQIQVTGTSSSYGNVSFQDNTSTTKNSIYSSSTGLTADTGNIGNFYITSNVTNKTSFDLSGNIATQGKITTGGDITCQNNKFSTVRSDCSSNMLSIVNLSAASQYQSASSNTTTFSGTVSTANVTNGAGGNLTLGTGSSGVTINATPLYVYNTSSTPQIQVTGTSASYGNLSFQDNTSTTKNSIYSSSTGLTADTGNIGNFYIASNAVNKTSFDLSGNIATQGKITTGGDITCQNNKFSTVRSDCSSNMVSIYNLNVQNQYQSATGNVTTFSGTVSTANLTNGAGGNLTLGTGSSGVTINATPLYVYNTSSTPQIQVTGTASQYGTLSFQDNSSTTKASLYASSNTLNLDFGSLSSGLALSGNGYNKSTLDLSGNFTSATSVNTGSQYKIGGTSVLTSTTLGSTVVNSSLTSLGTLTSLTLSGALTGPTSLPTYTSGHVGYTAMYFLGTGTTPSAGWNQINTTVPSIPIGTWRFDVNASLTSSTSNYTLTGCYVGVCSTASTLEYTNTVNGLRYQKNVGSWTIVYNDSRFQQNFLYSQVVAVSSAISTLYGYFYLNAGSGGTLNLSTNSYIQVTRIA